MHRAMGGPLGATGVAQPSSAVPRPTISTYPTVDLAVFGAHLTGGALNPQLRGLGGRFVRRCHTAARYRMVALPGKIRRPGLIDVGDEGRSIQGEIWSLPAASLAAFLATIGRPLGLGTVLLQGGETSLGFICEGGALAAEAEDVSHFGFWPAYLQSLAG
jgi:allophanate hydrolase